MIRLSLSEVAKFCNGELFGEDITVSSVSTDSRAVEGNELFFALRGERFDAHSFLADAVRNGAKALVVEHRVDTAVPYIVVGNTKKALGLLGAAVKQKLGPVTVGITGTCGKTTVKDLTRSILSLAGETLATDGNFNNDIGVPLTLLQMPEDAQAAVIEMGISGFGEMTRLAEMAQPTVCVLTIIGCCHLENLGDRDGVLRAKTEMFIHARDGAAFILNGDDDKLSTVESVQGRRPIFFGLDRKNDCFAENIKNNGEGGVSCTLCFDGKRLDVTIPAIGSYMVSNALAAVAVGRLLGLSDEQLKNGVEAYKTVGSRANVINANGIRIIDDCYNANPTSVKASLDTLMNFGGRKVAVLGDMKELGSNELSLHFDTGAYAKEIGVDSVIAVGPLAKELARGADGEWFESIDALKEKLGSLVKEGDTVLVKASHSMQFEKIVEFLKK